MHMTHNVRSQSPIQGSRCPSSCIIALVHHGPRTGSSNKMEYLMGVPVDRSNQRHGDLLHGPVGRTGFIEHPHVGRVRLQQCVRVLIFQVVDPHNHTFSCLRLRRRPKNPGLAKDFSEHNHCRQRVLLTRLLQQSRSVVDENGWSHGGDVLTAGRAVSLRLHASESQLLAENLTVRTRKLHKRLRDRFPVTLSHDHQTHAGNRTNTNWQSTQRPVRKPPPFEVVLKNLRFGFRTAKCLDNGKGIEELLQHFQGKLQDEFFTAFKREWLRSCKIDEPVHEIECDVLRLRVARDNHFLKSLEQSSWRRLSLHQPAHVVVHLALSESDRFFLGLGKTVEGGKPTFVMFQNVAESHVVIAHNIARLVTVESLHSVFDHRQEGRHLHDIVDRHQH
mmetsp:Transcript_47329/g.125613  ORF Transcript_47329/g.125613 Transcript_47329/m.125613 type:complete len:390 (-) Transcript_47329:1673-2842(-)